MTNKKSSQANLENKKAIFVLLAFIIALSAVFVALEWSNNKIKIHDPSLAATIVDDPFYIPVTKEPIKAPPPPEKPEIPDELVLVDNEKETETVDVGTEFDPNVGVEIKVPEKMPEIVEIVDPIVNWAEKMPEYPGGQAALFAFLNKNLRYPTLQQELGIQGKVICQFVVNKDGSIIDIEVVKSVDPALDKEAMRVISQMPKWTPGFQQDKTVRVKYTLPINFKLQ